MCDTFCIDFPAFKKPGYGTRYAEIEECGAFPGCKSGASGTTGHFTVMSWNGAQEIGCLVNDANIAVCRYKGQNFQSCATPNRVSGDGDLLTCGYRPKFQPDQVVQRWTPPPMLGENIAHIS